MNVDVNVVLVIMFNACVKQIFFTYIDCNWQINYTCLKLDYSQLYKLTPYRQLLWKSFIDFESELGEYDRARELYERLLQRTQHVKVWISYAQFESSLNIDGSEEQTRHVYDTADKELRKGDDKSARLLLLESWLEFEKKTGNMANVKSIRTFKYKMLCKIMFVYGVVGIFMLDLHIIF